MLCAVFERYGQVGNEALIAKLHKGHPLRLELSYAGVPRHLDRHQMECFALTLRPALAGNLSVKGYLRSSSTLSTSGRAICAVRETCLAATSISAPTQTI